MTRFAWLATCGLLLAGSVNAQSREETAEFIVRQLPACHNGSISKVSLENNLLRYSFLRQSYVVDLNKASMDPTMPGLVAFACEEQGCIAYHDGQVGKQFSPAREMIACDDQSRAIRRALIRYMSVLPRATL